jgi:hypothetical protein
LEEVQKLEEEQKRKKEEMKISQVVDPFREMNIKNRVYRDGEKVRRPSQKVLGLSLASSGRF